MQIHQLIPEHKAEGKKRIGRGGKRGTFSGRGSKGQKSRSGTRIRPGFRGGDNPIWKLFPKQRGASKKTDIKHALFQVKNKKSLTVNLDMLNKHFSDGDVVTKKKLAQKGLVKTGRHGVKILGTGALTKKLTFGEGVVFSKSAHEKTR